MKNVLLVLVAGVALTACGQYDLTPVVDMGVSANDTKSGVTVTKTAAKVDPATGQATPEKWTVSNAGPAVFTFTSLPGAQAAYIRGWKVTRDVLYTSSGAVDLTDDKPVPVLKSNVYVPSGYICATASESQSCDITDPGTQPANGVPSVPLSIDLSGGLADAVIATNDSVTREVDITFIGVSATGKAFELPVERVVATGTKTGDQ